MSKIFDPFARSIKVGEMPMALKALTGLSTPPGIISNAL
jgi:hypothetical protein